MKSSEIRWREYDKKQLLKAELLVTWLEILPARREELKRLIGAAKHSLHWYMPPRTRL